MFKNTKKKVLTSFYVDKEEIFKNKIVFKNALLPSLFCIVVFSIISIHNFTSPINYMHVFFIILRIVSFIVVIFFVIRLFDRRPKLIISPEGIEVRGTFFSWEDISNTYIEIDDLSGEDTMSSVNLLIEPRSKAINETSISLTFLADADYQFVAKVIEAHKKNRISFK